MIHFLLCNINEQKKVLMCTVLFAPSIIICILQIRLFEYALQENTISVFLLKKDPFSLLPFFIIVYKIY